MEEILMARKSAPREPKPAPDSPGESDHVSRKHQDEQHAFPENEGLVNKETREATDIEGSGAKVGQERQAAAQRGRVA
jgi:hypothetical protein